MADNTNPHIVEPHGRAALRDGNTDNYPMQPHIRTVLQ